MGQPDSLDDVTVRNQRTLKSIARAIALSEGEFSLILLRCNYQQLREKYLAEIRNINQDIVVVNLEPQTTTLYSRITEKLAQTKPPALMILGLEKIIQLENHIT